MRWLPYTFLLISAWLAPGTQASIVQRCEAPDGSLTFTDQSCAEGTTMTFQQAYSPPLGNNSNMLTPGSGALMPGPMAGTGGPPVTVVNESIDRSAFRNTAVTPEPVKKSKKRSRPTRYEPLLPEG